MKKLYSFALVLTFAVSLFAFDKSNWTTNLNLGLSVPVYQMKIDTASKDSKGVGINFELKDQLIHMPSGFLFEVGLGIGGVRVNEFYAGEPQWGFDFNALLGLGYAFIRNEKAFLTLAGIFGYDISVVKKDIILRGYSAQVKTFNMPFFVGLDVSGTYRFTDFLGVYGSLVVGIPVGGFSRQDATVLGRSASEVYSINAGGFVVKPSLGLSLTFN